MTEILKIEQMKRVDSSDDGDDRNGFLGLLGISCNQTSSLSNTAEIVENERSVHLTPLQWSKFKRQLVLTRHSAGVSQITKN